VAVAGRRLGQHFLNSRGYLERIAAAACPEPEPLVVEIGPGRGALTERLLACAGRVVAIELDKTLAAFVRARFASANLTLIEADVLEVDLSQWGPAVIAGNLPYYISSPILEKLFGTPMKRAVLLLQKEVASRLAAEPGTREYGFLTVHARLYTTVEVLFRVPPSAFSPPPEVDSAAVRLTPAPPARWGVADPGAFLEFASRCFRQKRKTLRNNLAPYYPKALLDVLPETRLRAEQVPIQGLAELQRRLARS
jgi:16S rRNA (adenine1518-N6/adenine1519-N6)-dimethyltransferase